MKKKIIAISIVSAMVICNSMTVLAANTSSVYKTDPDTGIPGFSTEDEGGSKDVNGVYKVNASIDDKNNDGVPDVDDDRDNNPDEYIDANGDGTLTTPTGATYSVDIVWGDMNFVFQAGKTYWDSEEHVYKAVEGDEGLGTWTPNITEPAENISNKISVTNNSNVAILTEINYEPDMSDDSIYKSINGSLKDAHIGGNQMDYTLTKGVSGGGTTTEVKRNAFVIKNAVTNTDITKVGYLQLNGNPDSSWSTFKKIGTVTITINYAIVN